jgi:transposase
MANEFCLTDVQWAAMEPCLPKNQPGTRRVDDRRVIGGIIPVMTSGCRWRDCPSVYGPYTTVYNRWDRWCGRAAVVRSPVPDFPRRRLSIQPGRIIIHSIARHASGAI